MKKYIGIRYASAERFGEPVPEDIGSIDDIECKRVGCPQIRGIGSRFFGSDFEKIEESEDCLRLAIYTPSTDGRYPVLVFIHGGSYISGCGLYRKYDASELAEREECVVVNISYRVGMFGFYHDDNVCNLGLKDQICALGWIKRNIHLFGGDSDRVTLMGQSAGAHSVLCIIAMSEEILFRRAIVVSAPFLLKSSLKMKLISQKFLKKLGEHPEQATSDECLLAQEESCHSPLPFTPICENYAWPKHIIPGLEEVLFLYQKNDARPFSIFGFLNRFITEYVFGIPVRIYSHYINRRGINTQVAVRKWGEKNARFGAIHFMEIPLLMGGWDEWKSMPFLEGISHREFLDESARFMDFIGEFVRH